jgi:hypothetical protein
LTEEDGLPSNYVYGLLEDDSGLLWASSVRGVFRFDPTVMRFKHYDVSDGLQSNEFSSWSFCKCSDGELFFGGVNGFNSFYPEDLSGSIDPPEIVITDFLIFNKSVPVGKGPDGRVILQRAISETDQIVLSHLDDVISVEYAALQFFSPEKNEYAYKLEGLESEWNYVGNRRFVTYTNLPAGDYSLRIKAANKDGVWNEEGVALGIQVKPPYWQTYWFRGVALFLILLFLVSLYLIRVQRIKVRNKQLEEAVKERTAELRQEIAERSSVEKERERLISELQRALAEVKTLTGMLPICASCKRIRDDEGYWQQVEVYVKDRSDADFSHAICPDCLKELYPEIYGQIDPGQRSE